jgi:hypothetical protein
MQHPREWRLGANVFRFEPPDILWADLHGETSLEQARELVELYRELGTSRPFFVVLDMRDAVPLGQEPRRYLSENADTGWVLGIIYVGARLAHKAVARGIMLAAYMTGRADKSELAKVHFVSTHGEASELIARLRSRHPAKVA